MISINNISFYYNKEKPIFNNLSLSFEANAINGIVGLNGSGKSTLLNLIYKFLKPDSGEILLNNAPINRRDIAFLESENYFYPNTTGFEYLSLFSNRSFDIEKWNTLFNLPLNSLVTDYSVGMKKRLAIFGLIKQNKSVLMLDEPFNGLDIESVAMLRELLVILAKQGKTILLTSHLLPLMGELCNLVFYIKSPNEVLTISADDFSHFAENLLKSLGQQQRDEILRVVDYK